MARSINQKIRRYFPKKAYFVICEDEKSMMYYLNGLKRDLKKDVVLHVSHAQHTDIKNIQKEVKEKEKDLKRVKDAYSDYKVMACFDRDNNDVNIINAIIAENDKVSTRGTIYNNPCYEYWLLLHTQKTNRSFSSSRECAEQCLKQINRSYSRNFESVDELKKYKDIYELVKPDLKKAIDNADSFSFEKIEDTYTNTHIFLKEIIP